MTIDINLLKDDPDIGRWLLQNELRRGEMDRAIELISSDSRTKDFDHAKAACLKAFDAIVDGIKVFFSFLGSDSEFAFALLDALNRADTTSRLCREGRFPYMFQRSESRAIGDVYYQQILDALRRTHWMFVVVPSDESVSSFVVFEIGAFSVNQTLVDKLICIHHPAVPPMELVQHFDQVETTQDNLSLMFQSLFINADAMPGMPPLCQSELLVQASASHTDTMSRIRPLRRPDDIVRELVAPVVQAAATLRPKRAKAVMLQFGIHLRVDATAKDAKPPIYLHENSAPYEFLRSESIEGVATPAMETIATSDLDSKRVSGTETIAEGIWMDKYARHFR